MKRKVVSMLVLMLVISCIGCGNQAVEDTSKAVQDTEAIETVRDISEESEDVEEQSAEVSRADVDSLVTEKDICYCLQQRMFLSQRMVK